MPLVPVWRVDRAFDYVVPEPLRARLGIGSLVRVPFGGRRVRGVVVGLGSSSQEPILEPIAALVVTDPLCPPPLDRLFEWIALRYGAPRGTAFARAVPPRVRVVTAPGAPLRPGPQPRRLSAYEGGAELARAVETGASGGWCLRPVAGEDRGRLIAELVGAAGRAACGAALVAVPEVRYGSSVLDAVAETWTDAARVDSSRSERERASAWMRLAAGHGLGIGGRASVLAPAPSLRLIVVDEEHHATYKEERAPRYVAPRVALERARLQGAVCVLVSPTPSLETGYAAASNRLNLVAPGRARARAARPIVELLERPRERILSRDLHRRVAETLRRGERVALLVPRRGYARAVWCASCRRSLRCPSCEAGLGYDRAPAGGAPRVRCARCGFAGAPPEACPTCGAREWRFLGAGSERLVEQVRKAWPRALVRRADPDVAGVWHGARAPDIYVTTWIGTKAALRPSVTLVGVLDADALIRRPDFRAAESAYQALAEMAEWAGPAAHGGRLLIQCSEPSHHSIQAVARADYGFFLERELEQRAELDYPPFSELVRLDASGARSADVMERAAECCRRLGATVLGPVTAGVAPGRAAAGALQALVKCPDATAVAVGLRGILARVPQGSRLRVDVDPR
ncbi:MAG: primosomal protein N' [Actinomycetota bacterium]